MHFASLSLHRRWTLSTATTLRIGDCDSEGNFLWDSVHKQWLLFHRLWLRHGTPAHPVGDPRNFRCVRRLVGGQASTSWPAPRAAGTRSLVVSPCCLVSIRLYN